MIFSQKIETLEPSATLAIAQRVRDLRAEGKDVVGLTLGEPDFDTPAYIRDAAKKALDDGFTHYPPVAGLMELREAIAAKLLRENNLKYEPTQIVVSTGAKQSIHNVMLAMLNPGDEVVLVAPYWVSYDGILHLAGANIKRIETTTEQAFKLQPEQLEATLTPQSRLIVLNTPSNPTGSMYSKEELAALAAVLAKYPNLYIISDEIYEHIAYNFPHTSLGIFEEIFPRVITINGFSKNFAMTGWRLGYIAADLEIVKRCTKLQGQCTSGANAFAQKGAIAALTGGLEATIAMREAFRKRREIMFNRLQGIEGVKVNLPDGAFYFYPDVGAYLGKKTAEGKVLSTIDELCLYLLDKVNLAVVPGSAFGTRSHIRISYAYAQSQIDIALDRLEEGLGALS